MFNKLYNVWQTLQCLTNITIFHKFYSVLQTVQYLINTVVFHKHHIVSQRLVFNKHYKRYNVSQTLECLINISNACQANSMQWTLQFRQTLQRLIYMHCWTHKSLIKQHFLRFLNSFFFRKRRNSPPLKLLYAEALWYHHTQKKSFLHSLWGKIQLHCCE